MLGKTAPDGTRIDTDLAFVLYLLDHVGVSTIQGSAYGMSPFFRLSVATSMETLRDGCDRIEAACRDLK